MDKYKFGNHLLQIRTDLDMPLEGMSKRTGMSVSYLNNLERGNINKPKPQTMKKIAAGYKIELGLIKNVFKKTPRREEDMMIDVILKQIISDPNMHFGEDLQTVLKNHELPKEAKVLYIRMYEEFYNKPLLPEPFKQYQPV